MFIIKYLFRLFYGSKIHNIHMETFDQIKKYTAVNRTIKIRNCVTEISSK